MPGTPDAKFGLSDAIGGTDEGSTLDERVNELNDAVRELGAGTIDFDRVRVSSAGNARLDLDDTSAGANLKRARLRTNGGVSYLEALDDAYTTVLQAFLTLAHATGTVTVPAGKLVDGVRTVRGSVRGRINANGTINQGTGFTMGVLSNLYTVTFDVAFTAAPFVNLTAHSSGFHGPTAEVASVSTTALTVRTYDAAGSAAQLPFFFEASEF